MSDQGDDARSQELVHPEEVHPTRRRLELTIMTVGAGAALLAAVLSTFSTMRVADIQAEVVERGEKVNAYTGVITTMDAYSTAFRAAPPCEDATAETLPDLPRATEEKLRLAVTAAASRAYLLGSAEAAAKAGRR